MYEFLFRKKKRERYCYCSRCHTQVSKEHNNLTCDDQILKKFENFKPIVFKENGKDIYGCQFCIKDVSEQIWKSKQIFDSHRRECIIAYQERKNKEQQK